MRIFDCKYLTLGELIDKFGNMEPQTPVPANVVAGMLHNLKYPTVPNPYEAVELQQDIKRRRLSDMVLSAGGPPL